MNINRKEFILALGSMTESEIIATLKSKGIDVRLSDSDSVIVISNVDKDVLKIYSKRLMKTDEEDIIKSCRLIEPMDAPFNYIPKFAGHVPHKGSKESRRQLNRMFK